MGDKVLDSLDTLKARATNGDGEAAYLIGEFYYFPEMCPHPEIIGEDKVEAVKWYRQAAALGNTQAMYALAIALSSDMFLYFIEEEAYQWVRKAAELGDPGAQTHLGFLAKNDHPYLDLAERLRWLVKIAWKEPSVFEEDIPKVLDLIRAQSAEINSYFRAAEEGDSEAQFQMGHAFYAGYGVQAHKKTALDWWKMAADQGHVRAKQVLMEIEEN